MLKNILKNIFTKALLLVGFCMLSPTTAFAATHMLQPNDFVGISFWVISMGLVAATAFFFLGACRNEL